MKSKKSLLSLGLLALVLVLGVGYAVVSSVDLTIGGSASVKGSTLAVAFTDTTDKTDATNGKVTATATNGQLSASIRVVDLTYGETVTATYTVKNSETDVNASILKDSITVLASDGKTDLSSYFTVTTDVDDTAKIVEAGKENTVTVTVKLSKTPVNDTQSTANVTVVLEATPVEKAN